MSKPFRARSRSTARLARLGLGLLAAPLIGQALESPKAQPTHGSAAAVAELVAELRGGGTQRSVARQRLVALGRAAIPALLQAVESTDLDLLVRLEALRLAHVIRPTVRDLMPLFERYIRPRREWSSEQTAIANGLLRTMRGLSDSDQAIQQLAKSIDPLIRFIEDQRKRKIVRPPGRLLRNRLGPRLPPTNKPFLPLSVANQLGSVRDLLDVLDVHEPAELVDLLEEQSPILRTFAAERLGSMDPGTFSARAGRMPLEHVLDRLAFASQVPRNRLRWRVEHPESLQAAARAICKLAPTDSRAITGWILNYRSGDRLARARAVQMLGNPMFAADRVLPTLRRALQDLSVEVVREAVTALAVLGPAAAEARPEIEALFFHADKQVAQRARAALRSITR